MPNDPIADAKNALKGANSSFSGALAAAAGVKPAGARVAPVVSAKPAAKPSNEEFGTPERSVKEGLAANRANVEAYAKQYPKMHNGGPVPADGVYQMKKGEHVLTEAEAKKARKYALMGAGMKSLAKAAPKVIKAAKENKKSGGLTTTVDPTKMV